MLRKNIFKVLCLLLVLCTGVTFLFFNGENSSAEIHNANLYESLIRQIMGAQDYSNYYTSGTIPSEYSLRDDYIIYTQMQNPYGLCWAYAGTTALATTLEKATGEYIDISEGWISAAFNHYCNSEEFDNISAYIGGYFGDKYLVGGGGNFIFMHLMLTGYNYSIFKYDGYGVVLESDFCYDEFLSVCNENVQSVYDMYSEYANISFMENFVPVYFNNYTQSTYSSSATQIKNSMKWHITKNGGINAGMRWGSTNNGVSTQTVNGKTITYKTPNTASESGHAITLIGWDDNITINGTKGAWIALNSWGDNFGDDGMFYISYSDTDFDDFWGYQYNANTADMYFTNKIIDSTAYYETDKVGKYYGSFSASGEQTDQKNIFYKGLVTQQDNGEEIFGITYDYNISSDVIENDINVEVYYYDTDVTTDFNIVLNENTNQISIASYELPAGTYKVITTYSNGTETEECLNVFYVMDGTELNYTSYNMNFTGDYITGNDGGNIKNNGRYALYNDYNSVNKNIILASTKDTSTNYGCVIIFFQTNSYGKNVSITSSSNLVYARNDDDESCGYYGFEVYFDIESSDNYIPFTITATYDSIINERTFNINVLKATTSDSMINIIYNTDGGRNSDYNANRVLVSDSASAKISAPTREGYDFAGWYTDKNLTSALTKSGSYWLLPKSKCNIITNPTIDSSYQTMYNTYYGTCSYVHLYAKWTKIETTKFTVTFVYGNGTVTTKQVEENTAVAKPSDPTRVGYTFIGWYLTETIDENSLYDFSSLVTSNFTLYALWQINTFTVNFYYYDTQTINKTQTIEYGTKISKPTDIEKLGYTLVGWYKDSQYSKAFNFNTIITSNLDIYVLWKLNSPSDIKLETSVANTETYTNFMLTLKFSHELNFDNSKISVFLIKNSTENSINTTISKVLNIETNKYNYTITIVTSENVSGTYDYYAKVILIEGTYSVTSTTNTKTIIVNDKAIGITDINVSRNGLISWVDSELNLDSSIKYLLSLKKQGNASVIITAERTSASWDISGSVKTNGAGTYIVSIKKYLNENVIGEVSQSFVFHSVSLVAFLQNASITYDDIYVPYGLTIGEIDSPQGYKEGYNFLGWYTNRNYAEENKWDLQSNLVEGDITLYANWEIVDDIKFGEVNDINVVYNRANNNVLQVIASHDFVEGDYSYKWYKLGNEEEIIGTNNLIYLQKVFDSGTYYCVITLTDFDGFAKTNQTTNILVNIEKATTNIIVTTMEQKIFTYNGSEQTITGAVLDRTDEADNVITYQNNKFKDVPQGGKLTVTVLASETDNYKPATVNIEVTINKALGIISAETYQTIKYTGKALIPVYQINNSEQTVYCEPNIIDAGKYENVLVIAEESQNYFSSSTIVTVEVLKAIITIVVKDITSVWLFNKADLEYEIIGEYAGEKLNIELVCDVDVNKIGKYTISVNFENKNYKASVFEGTYTVTAMPYYIGVLTLIVLMGFAILIHSRKLFIVEFAENGGSFVKPIETRNKKELVLTEPTKEGYDFVGWYTDSALTKRFKGKFKRGKNQYLYAKWKKSNKLDTLSQEQQINKILRELNIVTDVEEPIIEQNINEVQIKEPVIEPPKEKTQKEKMEEIILSTNSDRNVNEGDVQKVLTRFDIKIKKYSNAKKEQKPKTHEEIMEDLIKKAQSTKPANSNFDMNDFINNVTNKNED